MAMTATNAYLSMPKTLNSSSKSDFSLSFSFDVSGVIYIGRDVCVDHTL